MHYKDTKVMVHSPEYYNDYFDIIDEVLQENTLTLFLFIICRDYILRTTIDLRKERGLKLK